METEKKRLVSLPSKLDELLVEKSRAIGLTVTGLIKLALWQFVNEKEEEL